MSGVLPSTFHSNRSHAARSLPFSRRWTMGDLAVRDSRSPPFPPALAFWRRGSPSFGSPVDRAKQCTDSPLLYARLQPNAQNAVEPVDRTSGSIPGSRAWFKWESILGGWDYGGP